LELLLSSCLPVNPQNVEADSFGERAALPNGHNVTGFNTEARGAVGGNVLVSLLISAIFPDKVEVVSANDNRALHFSGSNHPSENTSTDRNVSGEGALLIDVSTFNGLAGGFESQSNIAIVTASLLLRNGTALGVQDDGILFLEGLFVLDLVDELQKKKKKKKEGIDRG